MGMYTQLHYGVRIKKETDPKVIDILQFMAENEKPINIELPNHPFFKCARWQYLFSSDSYYFDYKTHVCFKYDEIVIFEFILTITILKCSKFSYYLIKSHLLW